MKRGDIVRCRQTGERGKVIERGVFFYGTAERLIVQFDHWSRKVGWPWEFELVDARQARPEHAA